MLVLADAPRCTVLAYLWRTGEPVAVLRDTAFVDAAFCAIDSARVLALEERRLVRLTHHARKRSYVRDVLAPPPVRATQRRACRRQRRGRPQGRRVASISPHVQHVLLRTGRARQRRVPAGVRRFAERAAVLGRTAAEQHTPPPAATQQQTCRIRSPQVAATGPCHVVSHSSMRVYVIHGEQLVWEHCCGAAEASADAAEPCAEDTHGMGVHLTSTSKGFVVFSRTQGLAIAAVQPRSRLASPNP